MLKTYGMLLKEAADQLEKAGVKENRLDAWYLFEACFSMDRASYFLRQTDVIGAERQQELARFREMLALRTKRIPLQQILGEQEFMGLSFLVTEDVLIPRQDTEDLVEAVLNAIKEEAPVEILDLCTGSGCIGLSLAAFLKQRKNGAAESRILLADLSDKALAVAEKNRKRLEESSKIMNGAIEIRRSDLFEKIPERFDYIVSNPPYIRSSEVETLETEVKDHEPRMALDGSEDGLFFYRTITEQAGAHLKPGGMLFFEIGWDQGEAVELLLKRSSFTETGILRDLTGKDRIVFGRWDSRALTDRAK